MKFSEIIKSERKKRHMTQPEFAELVGLSLHTICNYETGKALPRTREIAGRIADALNLNLSDILGEEVEFELESDESFETGKTSIPTGSSVPRTASTPTGSSVLRTPSEVVPLSDSHGKATAERLFGEILTLYAGGNITDSELDALLLDFQRTLSASRHQKRTYS